ncbi:MAG: hypothetical protein ABS76_27025 [Pelagibacterium sp. SCN 64-44]|nr:MAG: hypothetical protein ABS76_27025 [Pelagibacterium sp. SCN 64-44]
MAADEDDPGDPLYWEKFLAEVSAAFEPAPETPPSLEVFRALYASVIKYYGHACAMTGEQFAPSGSLLRDDVEIVPIRQRADGGSLHVSNFLCLSPAAANAFQRGHVAVGPGLELLVDLSRVDPELLEKLNPQGRLLVPENPLARPDPLALGFHRQHVFLSGA